MANTTIILFLFLLVPLFGILIGVYVYRDAKRRNMNAPLWTLISILSPYLIGFIIYLLVRGNYSDLRCPRCNTSVTNHYVVCPQCGAKLKASCPNCSTPVEPGWKVCPICANPLSGVTTDIKSPIQPKDKGLGKILFLLLLFPALLVVLLLFSVSTYSGGGATNIAVLPIESYLEEKNNPDINVWYEQARQDPDTAHVLQYKTEYKGQKAVHFLVYLPGTGKRTSYKMDTEQNLFGLTTRVEFTNDENPLGQPRFYCVSCYGKDYSKLKLSLQGEEVDCKIMQVDFNPALFQIVAG